MTIINSTDHSNEAADQAMTFLSDLLNLDKERIKFFIVETIDADIVLTFKMKA